MIAEIISVGTELLLGQIVNTDATFIAKRLAEVGINSYYQTVVGDNPVRLAEALKIAEERSQLLILTGGLGPTQDDVTKETVADYLDEELVMDRVALKYIKRYFDLSGRVMTDNNQKQALYFKNGHSFPNRNGHAVGTFIQKGAHAYLLVPGPPKELTLMFDTEVLPFLETLIDDDRQYILSKTLRFFGIGESDLATKLNTFIVSQTNPTIAPYAKDGEIMLRITASSKDEKKAEDLLDSMEKEVRQRLGNMVYSSKGEQLEEVVANMLLSAGITISIAESCTGGLISGKLTDVAGISKVFNRAVVSYSNESKIENLGVKPETLDKFGAVSKETAKEMAEGIREISKSDLGLSITGIAGPDGGTDKKPVGLVYIALAHEDGVEVNELKLWGNRNKIRYNACLHAINMVRLKLLPNQDSSLNSTKEMERKN